jgi:hypothetical protein
MQPDESNTLPRFRKLRTVWSVFWGLACAALIVLWVRSYWRHDDISYDSTWKAVVVESEAGRIDFTYLAFVEPSHGYPGWGFESWAAPPIDTDNPTPRFQIDWEDKHLIFPHWLSVVSFATLTILPWFSWHFRLRTLLIAITLVAAMLGLAVWASH